MGASRSRRAVASLCLAFVLTACGGNEPPPPPPPEGSQQVGIQQRGGPPLVARVVGRGDDVVILAHQYNADMSSWYPFADELASQRFRVVTFNFPGFCSGPGDGGCSGGQKAPAQAPRDLRSVLDWVRDEYDPRRVFLVGASMGGTASLLVAADERVDAVAAVSAPHTFEGLDVSPEVLRAIDEPVLFIAGEDDPARAAGAAQYFYDRSDDPKQLMIVPSDAHGAPLLEEEAAAEARTGLVRFLDIYRDAG